MEICRQYNLKNEVNFNNLIKYESNWRKSISNRR